MRPTRRSILDRQPPPSVTDPQEDGALHVELLRQRIRESGLSEARFATHVLHRDPRTVRRWLALETKIPSIVADFLENPLPAWPAPAGAGARERVDPVARGWMLSHIARTIEALAEGRLYLVQAWTEPSRVERDLANLPALPEALHNKTLELQERVHTAANRRPPDLRGARTALVMLEAVWK